MGPTANDVHVNTPLTNISIAMMQSAQNFISTRIFPVVPVSKQSDRYYTYDRGEFNRAMMARRAPATESAGGSYSLDNTPTYYCENWALHKDIPDEVRGNQDAAVNVDRETVAWLTLQALLRRELEFVANYFKTGIWTTEYTGVASNPTGAQRLKWSDANSTPIENVREAIRTVQASTGFRPNRMAMSRTVFDTLVDHPDMVDRVKYGQTSGGPAMVTRQALASLFEVDEIVVGEAIQNTADEGQAASHSFIIGNHVMLAHVPGAPGLMTPSPGLTFAWTGMPGVGPEGNRITTLRMPAIKADRQEIEMNFDMKVTAPDLCAFFNGIV